jgi:hypothetical protein
LARGGGASRRVRVHNGAFRIFATAERGVESPGSGVPFLGCNPGLSAAQLAAALQQRGDKALANALTTKPLGDADLVDEQLGWLVRVDVDDPRCHADHHSVRDRDGQEVRGIGEEGSDKLRTDRVVKDTIVYAIQDPYVGWRQEADFKRRSHSWRGLCV